MLQQTRVEAVRPFYARFMKELPTVEKLAVAEEEKLLKLWEGLGYYNRVRNMQKAARQIMDEFSGEFPRQYDQIRSLSGSEVIRRGQSHRSHMGYQSRRWMEMYCVCYREFWQVKMTL